MKSLYKYHSASVVLFSILLCILFFTKCINQGSPAAEKNKVMGYDQFAGSASCANCHKDICDNYLNTAHFHTSEIASRKTIRGNFNEGKNNFVYSNGSLVSMRQDSVGFYQAAYINGVEKKKEYFDIVVGSGTKGQTYLSWSGSKLVQLPITFFTAADQWSNSPGYPDKIAFNRPITSRCLECHSTFVEKISEKNTEPEEFNRNHMLLGVDCETCHGPALKHVEFQTKNPLDKKSAFIINPAKFTRRQSLDMCALCHGGRLQKTKPSFEFQAGDKLSDYFTIDSMSRDANSIDVHGNQYGLLAASKCFKMSATLTCVTCHNTHENEKGKTALFSQRCTGCHNDNHQRTVLCKMTKSLGAQISDKCTSCHMPEQQSMAIAVLLQGKTNPTPALMHTHLIKSYPDATQQVIAFINKMTH